MKKKKIWLLAILAVIALAAAIGYFALCALENQKNRDFWACTKISAEEVQTIELEYKGQRVSLSQSETAEFIETLSTLQEADVEDTHEFTPSAIDVIFVTDDAEIAVDFYWFPYTKVSMQGVIQDTASGSGSLPKVSEDRVDVKIGGEKYHFRFTTEVVWTEDLICQNYDIKAQQQGLLQMHELCGARDVWHPINSPYLTQYYSAEEIIEESELVLIGLYVDQAANSNDLWQSQIASLELFEVQEVLKGTYDDTIYALSSEHTMYSTNLEEFTGEGEKSFVMGYASFHNPNYEKGETYLLCIDYDRFDVKQAFCQYGTAVIEGDMLYPRYNAEIHPFYNVALDTVRELCQMEK